MESNDHIDYLIQEEAIINSVSVAPYRAFWHPQDPCYGPRAVAFRFGYFPKIKRGTHPSRDTIEFFYRSEEFPIDNEMKVSRLNERVGMYRAEDFYSSFKNSTCPSQFSVTAAFYE